MWKADRAQREGKWEVGGPSGDGKRYLQPEAEGVSLLFPVESEQGMELRIRPVWWPTGEQKLAHRFPYPLVRQLGPGAVDYVGGTVFATAASAGRVIAIDSTSEKVLGFVEVGGYVADLVADRENGKLYAADGLGDRVVEIDAKTTQVTQTFEVAGGPWSLVLNRGVLYVACREGKRGVALDLAEGKVLWEVSLPAAPINLELTDTIPTGLLVRFQEQTYNLFTLEPAPLDEQQYEVRNPEQESQAHQLRVTKEVEDPDWVDLSAVTGYHLASPPLETVSELVDVSEVTGGAVPTEDASRLGQDVGPSHAVAMAVGDPPANLVFFLSPSNGRIGIYDVDSRDLRSVEVGGYLSDLAFFPGLTQAASGSPSDSRMLFVVDSLGERILALNPRTQKIERTFNVPGQPWRVAPVAEVAWQEARDASWPWPPAVVNRLYVTCRGSRDVAVVDLGSGQIIKRVPLSAEPLGIKLAPMLEPSWWGGVADDRIHLVLQPRVAVEMMPIVLTLGDLRMTAGPLDTPEAATPRDSVSVPRSEREQEAKVFSAGGDLLLCVDGKRWVDLSAYADPQWMAGPALAAKEERGSITFAVDDGPEYDWAAGIWQTPDNGLFLVNGSESFWQYNAPRLRLGPGRHVVRVRAHSRYARLEAVAVALSPEPGLDVAVTPEPQQVHGQVPLISYQGVFYAQEPVAFAVQIANRTASPVAATISCSLRNYMGEESATPQPATVELGAGKTCSYPISLAPRDTGRFTLTVTVASADGEVTKDIRFLRLPKLEHPRLFLRKADLPAIEARMARYPNLFRRYGDWLERMSQKEGRFPERFLPPGLTTEACMALAPADITNAYEKRTSCAHRQFELGWRLFASKFAANYMKPDSSVLNSKLDRLLADADTADTDCEYHYHGVFFPGMPAAVLDLVSDQTMRSLKLYKFMASYSGEIDLLSWTLATLEEPLTPQKRAMIYAIMTLENNAEQYFEAHCGTRGGPWWANPFTVCSCPMSGYMMTFLVLHNFFGEPRLFEKPFFGGLLTFERYANPLSDNRKLLPNRGGPKGEPWRWILTSLSRQPVEQSIYEWDEWVKEMDGPLPGDERAAVDKLMALDGIALSGSVARDANHFVSGVSVPLALALGWYDPQAPRVKLQEMPETTVFDVEGWVSMRSGWDDKATEVTFISGVQDHTTRHKPNHLTVVKSGEYLLGTPVLLMDDGNTVGAWANSVVVNDKWREDWALNMEHPRGEEYQVINRFSSPTFAYVYRDAELVGYRASEGGWGGGFNLHGHQESFFKQDGRLLGYQTWPKLDFVAGDAANAWPVDEVSQIDRQMVFLKPDLLVIYDRVKLGLNGHSTSWIAATGPQLSAAGSTFTIQSGSEWLLGRVLLPEAALVATPTPIKFGWVWKDQRFLEIRPARRQSGQVEYLVVMRVGDGNEPLPAMELIHDDGLAGVKLQLGGRAIEVRFRRSGPVGGDATVSENGATDRYQFRDVVDDSYDNWRSDPRYKEWMTEDRFGFIMPSGN